MTPRALTRTAALAVAAAAATAMVTAPAVTRAQGGAPVGAAATPPNLITIVLDDARADDLQFLPRTRALLGEQGANFTHYYSSHSLCCPQRVTYLRGQFTHNHGVLDIDGPDGGWQKFRPLEGSTLATWLHGGGYRTGLFGKYLNGYPAGGTVVPPGWDEWHATGPIDHTDFAASDNGTAVRWPGYQADYVADRAAAFVRSSAAQPGPYFAYLTPIAPHSPFTPAKRHADVPVTVPPVPASYNETDVSDKPAWVRQLEPVPAAYWSNAQRGRARMLLAVDEMVERLVQTVAATGELDNTMFVLTSDNGYNLGEHRRVGKLSAYEESMRLPLLVRGPGIPAGRTPWRLASGVDLAPTLADYAGVATPDYVDGRSLRPLLSGSGGPWRKVVFAENFYWPAPHPAPTLTAVRGIIRKVVEYPATAEVEAYDLQVDPAELVSTPRAEWVAGLQERLRAFDGCARETCRAAEDGN
jgi:N-acetylglucosamine-6-sulfatase